MYDSPIKMFEIAEPIMSTIIEQRENDVVARVKECIGFDIDKDELMRALNYDRDQYDKGYRDGHRNGVAVGRQQILDELYTFMQKQGYEFESDSEELEE